MAYKNNIMYILIKIEVNDRRIPEKSSKYKKRLEEYIKHNGFYWSNKAGRFIDDKTIGIMGGSGVDYIIEQVDEI